MKNIVEVNHINDEILEDIIDVWKSSMNANDHIDSHKHLDKFENILREYLPGVEELYCYIRDEELLGFLYVKDEKIEMIFVKDGSMGTGIGTVLINYAKEKLDAKMVDIYVGNLLGLDFCKSMGFKFLGRFEVGEDERPYPVYRLVLEEYMPACI